MTRDETPDVTELLAAWQGGSEDAFDRLVPLVYQELRAIAGRHLSHEPSGHTLQSTALVHEAYLRLIGQRSVHWQNRAHFLAIAAQMMRRILVDHARRQHRLKRGGAATMLTLDESIAASAPQPAIDLLALDAALTALAEIDARGARVVELKFFSGLTIEETAEVLAISPGTVKRDWQTAKAWLYRHLQQLDEAR